MKKNEKIMIGILLLILIIMVGILVFSKTYANKIGQGNVENRNGSEVQNKIDETPKEIGRIIKANGKLYYDTGKISEISARCGTMDGNITSTVQKTEIPDKDGEANFEGARGYQYGDENTIEVPIENEGWVIFEAKEYSFLGKIKEVKENYFLVEPDEGEEIRKSADLISIGKLQMDTNVRFTVGEHVKISYDGYVMETYPAQIKVTNYEHLTDYEE